jgi:carbamoyl-phosphate synthase small subunit
MQQAHNLPTNPAVLLLADGTVFRGKALGTIGTTVGELAFNTGMTGYQEIFTDPSYFGQMLIMAAAHIGNYGVHADEVESDGVKISGLICKKFSETYSRIGASGSLQQYFEQDKVVGIRDVDTRALIRHIRHKGAMNAIISSDMSDLELLAEMLQRAPSMEGLELSSQVSCKDAYDLVPQSPKLKVALLDLGVKKNIARCLFDRECHVRVFPMKSSLEEMMSWNPDGFMLSNGPGDPGAMTETIALTKSIIETGKPVFGICLGHQIICLSQGLKTVKMFNGHRGINHPVMNVISGVGEITSQNHGFVVLKESAEANPNIEITHLHLNDGSLAGVRLVNKPVFCVQYHPESSPGPHDSRYLFDDFVDAMKVSYAIAAS